MIIVLLRKALKATFKLKWSGLRKRAFSFSLPRRLLLEPLEIMKMKGFEFTSIKFGFFFDGQRFVGCLEALFHFFGVVAFEGQA